MGYAKQSRAAAATDDTLCLLLDVRGQSRPQSLQVWSYAKQKVVSLPRSLIRMQTPNAKRWHAVMVPRWLMTREGLYHAHEREPSAVAQESIVDTRTRQERCDDAERSLAQTVCDMENRYRRLPGQYFVGRAGTWGI